MPLRHDAARRLSHLSSQIHPELVHAKEAHRKSDRWAIVIIAFIPRIAKCRDDAFRNRVVRKALQRGLAHVWVEIVTCRVGDGVHIDAVAHEHLDRRPADARVTVPYIRSCTIKHGGDVLVPPHRLHLDPIAGLRSPRCRLVPSWWQMAVTLVSALAMKAATPYEGSRYHMLTWGAVQPCGSRTWPQCRSGQDRRLRPPASRWPPGTVAPRLRRTAQNRAVTR